MKKETKSLFRARFGIKGDHWFPFSIRWRSPIVVSRLHRFKGEGEHRWHSETCWCRRG